MGLPRAARDSTSSQDISPELRDGASCEFGRLRRSNQKFWPSPLKAVENTDCERGNSQSLDLKHGPTGAKGDPGTFSD